MKRMLIGFIFFIFSFFLFAQEISYENYKLHQGDVISIEVLDHGELSKTITILPDGTIEYPILGNMKVIGLTPGELSEIVKRHLTAYITIPVVTVYVRKIYGNKINIIGFVNHAGSYQIYKPIDIPQALSLASGITNIRKVKYLKILRKDGELITVKLSRLWENKKKLEKNKKLLLYPGDTLIIPPPKEFNWAMLSSIISALGFMLSVYSVFGS